MLVFEDDVGRSAAAVALLVGAIILIAFLIAQRRRRAQHPADSVHPINDDGTGGPLYKDVWGLRPGQTTIEEGQRHRVLDDEGPR